MNSTQPRTGFASKIRFGGAAAKSVDQPTKGFASKIRFASGSALSPDNVKLTEEQFADLLRQRKEAQQKQLLAARQPARYTAMSRPEPPRITRFAKCPRGIYGVRRT